MLPYPSQIAEEAFFFSYLFLEHDFMIANLVRLNLTVLCYVSKVPAFIPQLNQFHSGCY